MLMVCVCSPFSLCYIIFSFLNMLMPLYRQVSPTSMIFSSSSLLPSADWLADSNGYVELNFIYLSICVMWGSHWKWTFQILTATTSERKMRKKITKFVIRKKRKICYLLCKTMTIFSFLCNKNECGTRRDRETGTQWVKWLLEHIDI